MQKKKNQSLKVTRSMPRGVFVSKDQCYRIYYGLIWLNLTPEQIFESVFFGRNDLVSMDTVRSHCDEIRTKLDNQLELDMYLYGPLKRGGKRKRQSNEENAYMLSLSKEPSERLQSYTESLFVNFISIHSMLPAVQPFMQSYTVLTCLVT